MATIQAEAKQLPEPGNAQCIVYVWHGMKANDEGAAVENYGERSVQVEGEFFQVLIEGSNDGANFHTLHNLRGDELAVSQPGLHGIQETCRFVRPFADQADDDGVTVTMMVRPPVAKAV